MVGRRSPRPLSELTVVAESQVKRAAFSKDQYIAGVPSQKSTFSQGAANRRSGYEDPTCIRTTETRSPSAGPNHSSAFDIIRKNKDRLAVVMVEGVQGAGGCITIERNFLKELRDITREEGILLLFDEVFTGFRLALGGAQEYFNVIPDIATFGKGLANGYPLSAVAGKAEIMQLMEEVFFSFTFGGETLSLAASRAVLAELEAQDVYPAPGHSMARFFRNQDKLNETEVQTDLKSVLEFSDAVVLAVRHREYLGLKPDDIVGMIGRPAAIIDCFGVLDDERIRRYFELGCEVKGLGRGHVKRIKDDVRKAKN